MGVGGASSSGGSKGGGGARGSSGSSSSKSGGATGKGSTGTQKSAGATGTQKSASATGKTAKEAQKSTKTQPSKAQPKSTKAQPQQTPAKKGLKAQDTYAAASLKACPVTGPLRSPMSTRTHPITGKTHTHKGIDISAPTGTPVRATHDGVVSASSFQYDAKKGTGYGNHVTIDGASVRTLSAHLTERNVKVGDTVKAGDVIGTVGTTGGVTGAHLHFETSQRTADGWDRKDPQGVLSGSGLDCLD
ncbi:M23 family metallopeptidase [Stigmatella erecta]|uniref:Peptidase family M23 n=1 Tax=Stigmatella erecta TaxID=83460 RepID=A0A1I0L557_9BACT|nr:M23 family metallopeptidase [Stigmatella erecta]SEU34022.1 Peptidase family M23 [Stigmatella erecta]